MRVALVPVERRIASRSAYTVREMPMRLSKLRQNLPVHRNLWRSTVCRAGEHGIGKYPLPFTSFMARRRRRSREENFNRKLGPAPIQVGITKRR